MNNHINSDYFHDRFKANLMFRMEKTCKTFNIKPNPLNLLINRSLNRKKQFFCIMSTANRQLNKAEDNKDSL